jgi:hypothetical protein
MLPNRLSVYCQTDDVNHGSRYYDRNIIKTTIMMIRGPNFEAVAGTAFSVEAGIDWLRGLGGESLAEAHRYIRNAPASTRTPLRRALASDPWWPGLRDAGDPVER